MCEHWFGRHALDLSRLYDRAYVDSTYGGMEGMRRKFDEVMALPPESSDNRQRIARVRAFAVSHGIDERQSPRLLDVGAGLGVFPAAMAEAGWHVTALEPDARTVAHLETIGGIVALAQDLLKVDPASGCFHAITFNKVLEHVEDPCAMLMATPGLLSAQGFVYVEVPDVAAVTEGTHREEFFLEHHHVFSPASVAMLGERAGLWPILIERLREPSTKFTLRAFFAKQQPARQSGRTDDGCTTETQPKHSDAGEHDGKYRG